jgi:hypothetical protein
MATRRKQLTRDFHTCYRCGYRHIFWPGRRYRQTDQPLDRAQPMYLDVDDPNPDAEGYDSEGYRYRGRRVADLASWEIREADQGKTVSREAPGRIARVLKCWPLHACAVVGDAGYQQPATRNQQPAPLGGQDRAAGEHL